MSASTLSPVLQMVPTWLIMMPGETAIATLHGWQADGSVTVHQPSMWSAGACTGRGCFAASCAVRFCARLCTISASWLAVDYAGASRAIAVWNWPGSGACVRLVFLHVSMCSMCVVYSSFWWCTYLPVQRFFLVVYNVRNTTSAELGMMYSAHSARR